MATHRTRITIVDLEKIVRHVVIGIVLVTALLTGAADGVVLNMARLFK
jgi:hypothetical protein